ncbi:MAG: hypothetical protein AB1585_02180 [Thermodesulfobacteriota bacterium]
MLLADPVVGQLNDLTPSQRSQFFSDMAAVGDAVLSVTEAYRINYEILGNADAALHAHIFPRYLSEPDQCRLLPVWMAYSYEECKSRPFDQKRDKELMDRISDFLKEK